MRIEIISATSPHLPAVISLHRTNAATLGFLPEGAFIERARQGSLLVAIDEQEQCIGYLLYWTSRHIARIAHLCVRKSARRQGIARSLVDRLRLETRQLYGIRADCRRDYPMSAMWPRLGFYALSEHAGRARKGSTLTVWWLDHGQPNLFSKAAIGREETRLSIAIDANVFYDLINPTRPNREEALALQADWLATDIELVVSQELWNEINRGTDAAQRQFNRQQAQMLHNISPQREAVEQAMAILRPLFPSILSFNDEGDLRQLAHSVAAEVPFFVTRDTALLDQATGIYEITGTTIIRPSDLILRLDELQRTAAYQPSRLAGTSLEIRRVQNGEQNTLFSIFQHDTCGETREVFERHLRRLLAHPTTCECLLTLDTEKKPLALVAIDHTIPGEHSVPLLRTRRGPLAQTLVRYNILAMLLRTAQSGRWLTRITDPYLDTMTVTALQQDGFYAIDGTWSKLALAFTETTDALANRLTTLAASTSHQELATYIHNLAEILSKPETISDKRLIIEIERLLWPVKITNATIPTYLVPIQPQWAQELFDANLATQTLFGNLKQLALNREAIYYRSSHSTILSAPGRILWYVSEGQRTGYHGISAVRAVSQLDEVIIGPAKELYRRFQRFGVYEWHNILKTAGNNPKQTIMALRFSNTELFSRPIPYEELRNIYATYRRGLSVQGATSVSDTNLFIDIYQRGMRIQISPYEDK